MILYHAILTCKRDEGCLQRHVMRVDSVYVPQFRWCYYAKDIAGREPDCPIQHHVVDCLELYENLPVKVCGIMAHALTVDGWTHLMKADVNKWITAIDLANIEQADLAGFVGKQEPGRTGHVGRVSQGILNEDYRGPLPSRWCGGPAYIVSRRLAEKIVSKGAWWCRQWPWEDVMVGMIAKEYNMTVLPGLGVWDDKDYRNA